MTVLQLTPNELWWIGLGLFIVILVFMLMLQGAAYRNGCCDGYGYSKEPLNPGYRRAGEYLREVMAHRWSELRSKPVEVDSENSGISDFFDARPTDEPNPFDTNDMANVTQERRHR